MKKINFNPLSGKFDYTEVSDYITEGTNGITYFRMESPDDGSLWDLYIDSTGAWVSSPFVPPILGNLIPFGLVVIPQ